MPTRILVRVPKATAKTAAASTSTTHHQADDVKGGKYEAEAKLDECGLLTLNETPKQRAVDVEKRMLQPTSTSEPPTAHDDGDEEDEISSPPEKRVRKSCSVEGCTKRALKNGVCWGHGAKHLIKLKRCIVAGCTHHSQRKGVCWRHGAKQFMERCSSEGCAKVAAKNGECWKHAKESVMRKLFSVEGCTDQYTN